MSLSFGLIGYGHFGAFLHVLAQRYVPGALLKVHDIDKEPDHVLFFPIEEVAACRIVVLAVPMSAYGTTLEQIDPHLGADSVVVDVATVKKYTTDLLQTKRSAGRFLAMHPMFGPESYAKRGNEVTDLRIVITGHDLLPAHYAAVTEKLTAVGFSIVEKSADAHDRELAETLFLTHYIGQVVAHGGFERTDIDTVSFGYLMDSVDAVRHDGKLFEEVYRFNPHCREVIERFEASDRRVRDAMLGHRPRSGDP